MSMLDTLEKEFIKKDLIEGNTPELMKAIANSMCTDIPYRMKLAIAYSELILFFSQFRINIKHWNGSSIPVNTMTFCIARSGASKDSSVNACRECFNLGYKYIETHRKTNAVYDAIKRAEEAGVKNPESFCSYKEFYKTPNPLFISIPTPEGLIQHCVDLKDDSIGSGYLYISELGSEIASNPNFSEIIKIVAEMYDMGNKNAKIIKNKDAQNKGVTEFPMSLTALSSPSNILYDSIVKKKFKLEFTSKLARRSFFIYANEDLSVHDNMSVEDLLSKDIEREDKAIASRNKVNEFIGQITEAYMQPNIPKYIKVSSEVRNLFNFYKRYNEEQANIVSERLPMTKLSRAHMQWKAFKLAGALALSECSETILEEHYRAGIEFCELIADDIHNFEIELVKEPYELFTAYTHEYQVDGKYTISLHELRKAEFIPTKGLSSTAMNELTKLANSYDRSGTYTYNSKDNTISFTLNTENDLVLLSYLKCTGSKEQRAKKCSSGFICEEVEFNKLGEMLEGDYAYCNFKFANGVRGKENIVSGTKWIILDIDDSECTDNEAHLLLSDINHYVVRTSNKDIATKYRVIILLDREINIPDYYWIPFIQSIALDLGFKADKFAKSQIYFSYSDRNILSQLDGKPLNIGQYLSNIGKIDRNEAISYTRNIDLRTKDSMLKDRMTTFAKAYQAKDGEGRLKLIWAAKYARELGASKQYTKDLLYNISQEYWVKPLPKEDLETMYRQIDRWSGFTS